MAIRETLRSYFAELFIAMIIFHAGASVIKDDILFLPNEILIAQADAQPSGETTTPPEKTPPANPYANADISIRIISSQSKTFGYDILLYGRPLIHQLSIPGLPGNEGFKTENDARKVAELVVKKIKDNAMPPTVSLEELNSLGVLK